MCEICFLDGGIKSPFQRRKPKSLISMKKQVKFTDELKCAAEALNAAEEKEEEDSKVSGNDAENIQGWLES